jgi:hypothetical protein
MIYTNGSMDFSKFWVQDDDKLIKMLEDNGVFQEQVFCFCSNKETEMTSTKKKKKKKKKKKRF